MNTPIDLIADVPDTRTYKHHHLMSLSHLCAATVVTAAMARDHADLPLLRQLTRDTQPHADGRRRRCCLRAVPPPRPCARPRSHCPPRSLRPRRSAAERRSCEARRLPSPAPSRRFRHGWEPAPRSCASDGGRSEKGSPKPQTRAPARSAARAARAAVCGILRMFFPLVDSTVVHVGVLLWASEAGGASSSRPPASAFSARLLFLAIRCARRQRGMKGPLARTAPPPCAMHMGGAAPQGGLDRRGGAPGFPCGGGREAEPA